MKKYFAIVLLSLGLVFPAFAQDTTAEPPQPTVEVTVAPTPPPVETPAPEQPEPIPGTDYGLVQIVIIGLSLLLLGVIAVFGVTVVQMSRAALNSLPPWAVDLLRKNATPLLDQLDILTDIPNTQLDDIARAELRRLIGEILAANEARKSKS